MLREVDVATKVFLSDEDVARDVINLAIPNLLDPNEKLRLTHPEEAFMIFDDNAPSKRTRLTAVDRICDLLFEGVLLSSGERDYVIVGFENQTNVDRAMPVWVFQMNALDYTLQVERHCRATPQRTQKSMFRRR